MAPDLHDIPSLQRQLENVEGNDSESHKLYNNLGVAYMQARLYNDALAAHRLEKQACHRLSRACPDEASRLVDLAIAYRRCGDATLRVRALRHRSTHTVRERSQIASLAHKQHIKGLAAARRAGDVRFARVEVQAAAAACAHSLLAQGLATRKQEDLTKACGAVAAAARLATSLPAGDVSTRARRAMVHAAAVNLAIALSALGENGRAKKLLEATAVRARDAGDTEDMMRAVANLADECAAARDLEAGKRYAEMWVKYAKDSRDGPEEGDALRRLGCVLYEMHELKGARDAFQKAMLLAVDSAARDDAQQNLGIVEQAIEEMEADEKGLDQLRQRVVKMMTEGNREEEAKASMDAGNTAFRLRRYSDAIKHLQRYFALLDKGECDLESIAVSKGVNCTTIANMAESMWACKRFTEAVEWGTRELVSYGDEKAGQAQAWCNLGNYLSDNGQLEEGIDALRRSIEMAEEVGENGIVENAKLNLEIELEKLEHEKKARAVPLRSADPPVLDMHCDMDVDNTVDVPASVAVVLPRFSAKHGLPRNATAQQTAADDGVMRDVNADVSMLQDRCDSVVIFSGDAGERTPALPVSRSRSDSRAAVSAAFSTSRPHAAETRSRSNRSGMLSGMERSIGGGRRYIDIASAYKKLCANGNNSVRPRDGLLDVLRKLSARALTAGDDERESGVMSADFSCTFLSDKEVALLLRALSTLDLNVALSIARNPLLTDTGYRALASSGTADNIRSLNISGSGVGAGALAAVVTALGQGRPLRQLLEIDISKNGLGRKADAAADACAALFVASPALEHVNLAMNMLSCAFLRRLVQRLQGAGVSAVKTIDFRLNNRQRPNALLEFDGGEEAYQCVAALCDALRALVRVDVRACGAAHDVRRALYRLGRERAGVSVLVASEGVFDDAVL